MNKNINGTTASIDSFEEISEQDLSAVAGGGVWDSIKKGYNAYANSPVGRYFGGLGSRIAASGGAPSSSRRR